jgi:hypothetical protein
MGEFVTTGLGSFGGIDGARRMDSAGGGWRGAGEGLVSILQRGWMLEMLKSKGRKSRTGRKENGKSTLLGTCSVTSRQTGTAGHESREMRY